MSMAGYVPGGSPTGMTLFSVLSPSGAEVSLQTQEEADWYENNKALHLTHNRFTNVSDLQDLDRALMMEVIIFRWSTWITRGYDYELMPVDAQTVKNNIREWSVELRLLKQSLGLDRASREKDKGQTLSEYWSNLLRRAHEFGVHRNEQYEYAVTAMYKIRSMIMTHDRCDEEEREELDLSHESIVQWIRDNVMEDWDEIEEAFRKKQSIWIDEL